MTEQVAVVAVEERERSRGTEPWKSGWVSPSYRVSREVRLDPAVLEKNRVVAYNTASPEIEAYRVLRTRILHRTRGTGGPRSWSPAPFPGRGRPSRR